MKTEWSNIKNKLAVNLNGKKDGNFVSWNFIRLVIEYLDKNYDPPNKKFKRRK